MTESAHNPLAAAMAIVAADNRRFEPGADLVDAIVTARGGSAVEASDDPDYDFPSLDVAEAYWAVADASLDDLAEAYSEALTLDVLGGARVHEADGDVEMPSWMGGPASASPTEADDSDATVGSSRGQHSAYASDGQYARGLDETLANIDAALDEHCSDHVVGAGRASGGDLGDGDSEGEPAEVEVIDQLEGRSAVVFDAPDEAHLTRVEAARDAAERGDFAEARRLIGIDDAELSRELQAQRDPLELVEVAESCNAALACATATAAATEAAARARAAGDEDVVALVIVEDVEAACDEDGGF